MKMWFCVCRPLYVCMDVHLAGARAAGRVLLISSIQEFIRYRSVPVEHEPSSS
jgi:hypothetical protein